MTLQQMINQLHLVQAYPQPEYRRCISQEIQQSLTIAPQNIDKLQPVDAEFHQFSRLPQELREMIWRLALPTQRPLEINIRFNDERKGNCVWAVGPFAMLKVCQQSRQVALSVYEPRLELYTSREKPERVLCTRPNTVTRPEEHISIYMRREDPPVNIQPDLEVHSVVAWEDIPLGFMWMQPSLESISIKYFWNWPPNTADVVIALTFPKDRYEQFNRKLPWRLQGLHSAMPGLRRRRR